MAKSSQKSKKADKHTLAVAWRCKVLSVTVIVLDFFKLVWQGSESGSEKLVQ